MKILNFNLIFLTFFFCSGTIKAQDEFLDNIDIYLHTVDRGKMVYDNFGHTAVRIHNRNNGDDLVYNWGIFDFRDPVEFSLKFYRGILIYSLGVYDYESARRYYEMEKRTVWEDKLIFNREQKKVFLQRLYQNYLPENRTYGYHYFFNNCSTIVRDHISESLGKVIEMNLMKNQSGRTFRDTVREGYSTNPEIFFSLDLLMNGNIDKEMSAWQEMFLPLKLREHLLTINKTIPVISDSQILYQFTSPQPKPLNGYHIAAILLLIAAGLICSAEFRKLQTARKISWTMALLLIFILGIFGFTMFLNWILSGHIDLHHNWNMLLLWPTDLFLVWIIFRVVREKNLPEKIANFAKRYLQIHLIVNAIYFLIAITRLSGQNILLPALWIAPLFSIFLWLIYKKLINQKPISAIS